MGVLVRSLPDFAERGGCCFHGSIEVFPDEALEEYADGPGSPIVEFVDFLSDKNFRLVRQRDHHFSHDISVFLVIAPVRLLFLSNFERVQKG